MKTHASSPSLTLSQAFEQFLENSSFARRTRESYAEDLAPLFAEVGQKPVTALTTDVLQTFLVRQESLAPATYNRRLAALRSFTRWLREQGWVADTLLDGKNRKPEGKRTARALDAQQVESVLRTIEDPLDRALQAASLPPLWNGLPAQSTDGTLLAAFAGNTSPRELIPNSCLPSLHTLLEHLCPKNVPKRSASDNICGTKVGQ